MIYIAYFSTEEEDLKHGPRHGSFSCLVDADDPEDAVKKFEKHLGPLIAALENKVRP